MAAVEVVVEDVFDVLHAHGKAEEVTDNIVTETFLNFSDAQLIVESVSDDDIGDALSHIEDALIAKGVIDNEKHF